MSSEDSERMTPPPVMVADPVVRHQLERIWMRIEVERRERTEEDAQIVEQVTAASEALRKRHHDLANAIAKVEADEKEYRASLTGFHGANGGRIGQLEEGMKRIEQSSDKSAAESRSTRMWAIGEAVAIIIISVVGAMALLQRMATVEERSNAMREDLVDQKRQLDRIEDSVRERDRPLIAPKPAAAP